VKRLLLSIVISGAVGLLVGWFIDTTFGIVIALMLIAVLPVFFIKVIPTFDAQTDDQAPRSPQTKTNASQQKTLNNALAMAKKLRHDLEKKLTSDQNATHVQEEIEQIKEREEMIINELHDLEKGNKPEPPHS
jgi:uncharacterized membrane protein YhiD involved in acid resistance